MQPMFSAWRPCTIFCLSLLLAGALGTAARGALDSGSGLPVVTNIQQLRKLARSDRRVLCSFHLDAVVCSVNVAKGLVVLQDNSGAELFRMDLGDRILKPGDEITLKDEHTSTGFAGAVLTLGKTPVVDNDGTHPMLKQSGKVYLEAGRHPLRLFWFNGLGRFGLKVSFKGPQLKLQPIPDSVLSRKALAGSQFVPGLNYRCYEGLWINIGAGFGETNVVKTGAVSNFDISIRTRPEHAGLEFDGFIEAPRDGVYTFMTESDDGSLLFIGETPPAIEFIGSAGMPAPRNLMVGQLLTEENEHWTEAEGTVAFASESDSGLTLQMRAETGWVEVVMADAGGLSPAFLLHRRIHVHGVARAVQSVAGVHVFGSLAVLGRDDVSLITANRNATEALPVLTTGDQVKGLKREDADRGYPVKIHGVITRTSLPWVGTIVIQDATGGIFVRGLPDPDSNTPQFGEYWEIEGVTASGDFAPVINWKKGHRLGTGQLPQPVEATWDKLMNGSLDTQYVEIQGVVTEVRRARLQLLLPEGKINLGFLDRQPGTLARYSNALVRIRGCLFPAWNPRTHQLLIGEMSISSAAISIEEPAPRDVFATSAKTVPDLLVYDPAAGALKRVKITGQLLGLRAGQCFMTDGTNGVRIQPQGPIDLEPGDFVEAVGFPKLEGSSPLLREAVARKMGHAKLPQPRPLSPTNLLDASFDSTRVSLDGLLINRLTENGQPVLEVQAGLRTFVVRFADAENTEDSLPLSGVIRLTGVYMAQGGNRALGQGIDSFELLVNSPSDIRVLTQPPWLTLPRVLVAFGGVAMVLLGAMLWAFSLRRQVTAQTAIIRQKAQREVALEERARIAKDIHDDVGSNLTSIMMLGERSREDIAKPRELVVHTDKIVTYARATVQALDEIVWAINPENDTLDALVGYLNQYASQFFESTNVRCRLDVPGRFSSLVLPSEVRHDLFLVVKEALNNILKHANATEVTVAVAETQGVLEIIIEDNGGGFDLANLDESRRGDGLRNMRKRMVGIGGGFSLNSSPGHGSKLNLLLNLEVVGAQSKKA